MNLPEYTVLAHSLYKLVKTSTSQLAPPQSVPQVYLSMICVKKNKNITRPGWEYFLALIFMVKKDVEIKPGFEPGSSEFQSDALIGIDIYHVDFPLLI